MVGYENFQIYGTCTSFSFVILTQSTTKIFVQWNFPDLRSKLMALTVCVTKSLFMFEVELLGCMHPEPVNAQAHLSTAGSE